MRRTVRSITTALSLGFALYFAARAIWWVEPPTVPVLMIAAIVLYLAAVLTAVLATSASTHRMPLGACVMALLASGGVPVLVTLALEPSLRMTGFATWYIGALGLLGVVCVVRRRSLCGGIVLLVLIVAACISMGPAQAFRLGLVGSITWVVVAQLLMLFWDRAVRDTERLADIQQAVSAWNASQVVRQRERRVRAQRALAIAGPVLARTVASHGELTADERTQARLAEGTLRDELRGEILLNDSVRQAIANARRRGSVVTVFDEGGLAGMEEQRLDAIRDELAEVLWQARSNRVIIRAGRDDEVAVTVVGRAAEGPSDDDPVDLWHEIRRAAD